MVEQLTVNQLVAGSNPVSGAKKKDEIFLVFFLCPAALDPNQAFCDYKKWFGVAKLKHRSLLRAWVSGEGFSRYPVSGAKVITIIKQR